ncbi:MAG TPA: hypothetical protein PLY70_02940 [Saprospiraceae bacterium]|nr:hypothetical protein [Saprospiraceae bacterium]HPN68677.1 hypothetical protein [Saprospiraceae bacterium]
MSKVNLIILLLLFIIQSSYRQQQGFEDIWIDPIILDVSQSSSASFEKSINLELDGNRTDQYLVIDDDKIIPYAQFISRQKSGEYNDKCITSFIPKSEDRPRKIKLIIYVDECAAD